MSSHRTRSFPPGALIARAIYQVIKPLDPRAPTPPNRADRRAWLKARGLFRRPVAFHCGV